MAASVPVMDARAHRSTLKERSKEPRALIWFARILEEATGDVRSKCLLAYPTSHDFTRQKHVGRNVAHDYREI
jgi:hypothetical protein